MAAAKDPSRTDNGGRSWRTFAVAFLVTLGSIAFLNWLVLRWAEKYLLNTDNYVATVAPLSRNETVASAISDYAVTNLYSAIDLQAKIQEALPEKAQFLAAPLSNQIVNTSKQVGTNIITSDQFGGFWDSANRVAHSHLITALRRPSNESAGATPERQVLGINISPLIDRLRDRLGSTELAPNITGQAAEIRVNLANYFNAARTAVRVTEALYRVLIYAVIACYLGAVAIAHKRWRTMMAIGLAVTVITALELILLKATRPQIVAQVPSQYQAAVGVVWDTMTQGFKTVTTNAMWLGIALTLATLLGAPYKWTQTFRHWIGLDRLRASQLGNWTRDARAGLRHYINPLRLAGVVLAFAYLLINSAITWQSIIIVALCYAIYAAILELVAARKLPA